MCEGERGGGREGGGRERECVCVCEGREGERERGNVGEVIELCLSACKCVFHSSTLTPFPPLSPSAPH